MTVLENQNLISLLKSLWSLLPRSIKQVLEYLWWMSKHLQNVFPSLATIAKAANISKRTAQNALKKLAGWGLVGWVKRSYRSNVYFLPNEILNLDFKDKRQFTHLSEESCHVSCHVLDVAPELSNSYVQPSAIPASPDVPKSLEEKANDWQERKKTLPEALHLSFMEKFDFKKFGWVIKKLSELDIHEILNDMKWFSKKQRVDNFCALFISFAFKRLQEKNA